MHMNLLLHPFSHQHPQTVDGALPVAIRTFLATERFCLLLVVCEMLHSCRSNGYSV